MAPWPEQGNELKSIDKVNEIRSSSFDETQHQLKADLLDEKGRQGKVEDPQDPQVLGLDEGQLKALLDEAITYKNPKDREGKSELFKELLLEVEADDKGGAAAGAGGVNVKNPIHSATSSARFNRNHRRSQTHQRISERNRSGGSLQNLVQACASELESGSRRRGPGVRNQRGSGINVSARQREGGSLPSNVNHVQGVSGPSTSLFDEYKRSRDVVPPSEEKLSSESGLCTDYSSSTNTHSRKTSSTWGDEEGIELEEIRAAGARTYTSRATLEVCTDPVITRNTFNPASVDTPVLFPLKSEYSPNSSPPENSTESQHNASSQSSYNYVHLADMEPCTSSSTTSSQTTSTCTKNESSGNVISTLQIPPAPISLGSATPVLVGNPQVSMLLARDYHTFTALPHAFHLSDFFAEPLQTYTGSSYISADKNKSGYDENGNNLSQSDRGKKTVRRHKAKNEKKTYLAETVDGFRGTLELHELLLFIENEPGAKKKNKMKKKTKDDASVPEHTKKRKGKDKLTKCNSLEEISKTKLEDLTWSSNSRLRPKKQVTLDDEELGWREDDSNSISADETTGRKRMKESRSEKERERDRRTDDEEAEFRLVQTKKHRRRKRRSSHNEQMTQADVFRTARSSPERHSPLHHHRHHRTSSMPPSDRSDCSDLDSVHSLPVTSQHTRRGGTNTPSSGPDSHEYASASTSPSGIEVHYGGVIELNHSTGGPGNKSRQRVTPSPGVTSSQQHSRSSSCTFGSTCPGGGTLVKAMSCHASSQCVNEGGNSSGLSLTKSTPNSTLNLTSESAVCMGRPDVPMGRNLTGTKSVSPELRRKPSSSEGVTHSQSSHAVLSSTQVSQDLSSPIEWTEGDYPPLPSNTSSQRLNSEPRFNHDHNKEYQKQSESREKQNGEVRCNEPRGGRVSERLRRNSEPKEYPAPSNRRQEPLVTHVNGVISQEESIETVTLSLNSNKHRAPSPPDHLNNNNSCDVFVEFNLPPPPLSPVNVTVEKTVIIRSQSTCTDEVSESVSLIIPPPNNLHSNSTNRKAPVSRVHSMPGTLSSSPLPPVILLDNRKKKRKAATSPGDSSDLTFGFEINRNLLNKDRTEVGMATLPQFVTREGDETLGEMFNYPDIVNFVEHAWKDVMNGFTSQKSVTCRRIDYYNHPTTANPTQPTT